MPVVLNKLQCEERELRNATFVDRTTIFGNPFIEGKDGKREEVVKKYAMWIIEPEQRNLRIKMRATLRGWDLVCHCAPLSCHADVILIVANTIRFSETKLAIEAEYGD